ncbi:hypothetical protein CO540_13360 [Micromonospora sp. WMMA2032]|uniref:hypothetical protein n=1 Tax=Micromonospora sp. WMMA2032 TaxID=2039870 RepID=UPI000C05AB2B|nr:hypothetical protein [Micromonospora sp. WMMA2032]ATO14696.1 hypothetical protein CO540_13360 [Micromonospora sp. WMMA2032]
MARYWFGGGIADWTFTTQDAVDGFDDIAQIVSGVQVTVYNAETGGTQVTDLLDADGIAATTITSSDGSDGRAAGTIPPFQGPDGVTELWASAGGGPRALLQARLGGPLAAVADLAQDTADDFAAYADSPPQALMPTWSQDTAAVGVGVYRIYNPTGKTLTLRGVVASVGGSTPAGSSLVVTLKVDGVEAFTSGNRPTIAAGQRTSGVASTFAVSAWPAGSYLTVDVIQVGSTTAGTKLTVQALAY